MIQNCCPYDGLLLLLLQRVSKITHCRISSIFHYSYSESTVVNLLGHCIQTLSWLLVNAFIISHFVQGTQWRAKEWRKGRRSRDGKEEGEWSENEEKGWTGERTPMAHRDRQQYADLATLIFDFQDSYRRRGQTLHAYSKIVCVTHFGHNYCIFFHFFKKTFRLPSTTWYLSNRPIGFYF